MKPHEDRVIAERADLAGRLYRLSEFMSSAAFLDLGQKDRELLFSQKAIMGLYVDVLNQRIDRFQKE